MYAMFANLGVNIGLDYAKYRAVKGDSGDYVDFLLHYDSKKAEEGDDSWMSTLFGSDAFGALSPEFYQMLDSKSVSSFFGFAKNNADGSLMIDAQVSALKVQLLEGFKKRFESEANERTKAAKRVALYAEAHSIKAPSRLLG